MICPTGAEPVSPGEAVGEDPNPDGVAGVRIGILTQMTRQEQRVQVSGEALAVG
jgi:hypothetical protein